ncbi:hypothetical protein F5X96DRAFT_628357 [Biscogniauxia mediterranea]|nr:hypothetical protein F5X96DRAFT_628357 [Biscogniauxia mediterranea]
MKEKKNLSHQNKKGGQQLGRMEMGGRHRLTSLYRFSILIFFSSSYFTYLPPKNKKLCISEFDISLKKEKPATRIPFFFLLLFHGMEVCVPWYWS